MTQPNPPRSLEAHLPHRGTMLLLTAIIGRSADTFTASVSITPAAAFYVPGSGVPAYAGLEYMAQTIAAGDGSQRLDNYLLPEVGFLLGSRRYHAVQDYFKDGDCLIIRVKNVFTAEGMAAFDCTIHVDDRLCAEATLNVYRPQSA